MVDDAVWEPVPGFPGYERTRFGEFRSWIQQGPGRHRRDSPRPVQPWLDRDGYLRVGISDANGKRHSFSVAAIVLEMNVGPRPPGMMVCHFPDRTRTNNHPDNLRWGTHRDNTDDMLAHGTVARGPRPGAGALRRGKRNGTHTKPESRNRGANHPFVKHPELCARGERSGQSKLSNAQVLYVFDRAGKKPRPHGLLAQLARELGVTKAAICHIVNGRNWSHLANSPTALNTMDPGGTSLSDVCGP
jgi:hypothetical protein